MVPNPAGPPGSTVMQTIPVDRPVSRTCGQEYTDVSDLAAATGGVVPTCACGLFGVGACVECSVALCANCLEKVRGRLMCRPCALPHQERANERRAVQIAEINARAEEIKKERAAAGRLSGEAWVQELVRIAERARREVANDYERLLHAARHWVEPKNVSILERKKVPRRPVHPVLFHTAFPTLWPPGTEVDLDSSDPPWDSDALAEYFAGRFASQGHKPVEVGPQKVLFFGGKGWTVSSPEFCEAGPDRPGRYMQVAFDTKGRIYRKGDFYRGRDVIGVVGIIEAADRLRLDSPLFRLPPNPSA